MKKNIIAAFIFLSGVLLVIRGYLFVHQYEVQKTKETFSIDARNYAQDIEREFSYDLDAVSSLQSFFETIGVPSPQAFHAFASRLTKNHKSIKVLAWHPRVLNSQRSAYEKEGRQIAPHYHIWSKISENVTIPTPIQPEYYPALYVEPSEETETVSGVELLSTENLQGLIKKSRDSGKTLATDPLFLIGEKNNLGFLIIAPIYKLNKPSSTLEERRQNIEGFIIGAIRFKDLVEKSIEEKVKFIDITLIDIHAPLERRIAYSSKRNGKEGGHFRDVYYTHEIHKLGETWALNFTPKPGHYLVTISPLD